MDSKTIELIQTQMNNERYNAQVYSYISLACENMAWDGFANFFHKQSVGELEHANKFADFLISKRIQPDYRSLPAVQIDPNMVKLAQAAYNLEVRTTGDLSTLYELCDDPQVCSLLTWFLTEQIEEEKVTFDLFDLISRTDENGWTVLDEKYNKF
jgi:ferritin